MVYPACGAANAAPKRLSAKRTGGRGLGEPGGSPSSHGHSVANQRVHVKAGELLAPLQEVELDQERNADDDASELLDEVQNRLHRAARGEHVVVDEHAGAVGESIRVHLEGVLAVLERVAGADRLPGQLPGPAGCAEAAAERVGEGTAEDEAACLGAEDEVRLLRPS